MRDILQMSWRRAPLALALGLILAGCADSGGADRLTSPGHQDDLGTPAEPAPLPPDVTDGTGVGADADPANIIVNGSFESGTAPWLFQGDAVKLSLSSDTRHSDGTSALLVEGRGDTWHGIRNPMPELLAGRNYVASVWMKLPEGVENPQEPPVATLLLTRNSGSAAEYITLASAPLTSDGWIELSGSFTIPATGSGAGYTLFMNLTDPTASYLLDDMLIKVAPNGGSGGVTPNLASNPSFEVDTSGWYASGNNGTEGPQLTRTDEVAFSGSHSARISGRTANWQSPNASLATLTSAGRYVFSMAVRLPEGAADTGAQLTLNMPGQTNQYVPIAQGTASADRWTVLRGVFDYPAGVEGGAVYLEVPGNATTDYFVDALQITQLSGERNLIPSGGAEANISDWVKMGDENVSIERSQEARYLGQYGVLVSGRTANWHGPAVNLLNLAEDNEYNLSVWMRMAPGAPATDASFTVKVVEDGVEEYIHIASNPQASPVTADGWTQLAGSFEFTPTGEVTELIAYIEASDLTASFYVDELTVTRDGSTEPLLSYPTPLPATNGGLAGGRAKFLGSAVLDAVPEDFTQYWNQVTPENSSKWGEVEQVQDVMDWTALDAAYTFAKANQMPFKLHTLVWGSQFPEWIEDLPAEEQRAEVEEWIAALAARYPETNSIDVVNEALKGNAQPPFKAALGGAGATGFDWVIWAFERAREHFPKAQLLINDYGILNDGNERARYKQLVGILLQRGLVDAIGLQGHYFNLDELTGMELLEALDDVAEMGLPIYITELDISAQPEGASDGTDDEELQSQRYQELFPVIWEHEAVAGVTVWNYVWGETWRHSEAVTALTDASGDPREALIWLQQYFSLESAE